jgi:hypothetical protein
MTRVRTQLRSALNAYRLARYPGDLSRELVPRPSAFARALDSHRFLLLGGVGASAAAAAVILSLLLSRASVVPQPWANKPVDRGRLADWLPIAPDRMPLPHFQAPSLPLSPPKLNLDIPAGVERYQDLAMQYRGLQVPESLRRPTVPSLPTDLPTRGVEWFHKVWIGEKSA